MPDNPENAEAPAKGPGLMTLIKAIAFVSVIVLLEVAAASMLIPSSEETAKIADQLAAADAAQEENGESSTAEHTNEQQIKAEDMVEVSLGSFHVVAYNPDSGSSMNVDFKLFGTVLADEVGEFDSLYTASMNRISEQITITVRGTDPVDLTDPGLGLIKRKILEKTNRALGKHLLHEAIFSDFSFVER